MCTYNTNRLQYMCTYNTNRLQYMCTYNTNRLAIVVSYHFQYVQWNLQIKDTMPGTRHCVFCREVVLSLEVECLGP